MSREPRERGSRPCTPTSSTLAEAGAIAPLLREGRHAIRSLVVATFMRCDGAAMFVNSLRDLEARLQHLAVGAADAPPSSQPKTGEAPRRFAFACLSGGIGKGGPCFHDDDESCRAIRACRGTSNQPRPCCLLFTRFRRSLGEGSAWRQGAGA